MSQRILPHVLMGLLSPAILFTFVILFGSQSYQEWNDRFSYELTNRFLFSRAHTGRVLGPLWREDILSGSTWATNKGPAPVAAQIVAARLFDLSPVWIELVGNLVLYFTAVLSMYVYLRRELRLGIESTAAAATMFGATAYWLSFWVGNPDLPMPAAWIPALLVLSHRIARASERGRPAAIVSATVMLALAFYVGAIHSVLASLPAVPIVVVAYAWFVFAPRQAVLWVMMGLGLGLLLHSSFMWSVVEAVRLSGRHEGAGFFNLHDALFDPSRWSTNVRIMLSQIAVGHNQYGLYLTAVLGAVAWWCIGGAWRHEPPGVRKILKFAIVASVTGVAMAIFDITIDYLKMWIPLFGAWHVKRFEHFLFFPVLTLVAWMLDRSIFSPECEGVSQKRIAWFRTTILCIGVLGSLQIGYSAYRMRLVPDSIYPQSLILYAYLFLYAAVIATLLAVLYRSTRNHPEHGHLRVSSATRIAYLTLIALSVSLTVSVHAYRAAVLPPKIGVAGKSDPIMTYAERYSVPADLTAVKELNRTNGRVVDLTRPWYPDTLGPASETTLLPLAGLRTPSGYNLAPTRWYERFLRSGINGSTDDIKYVIQVHHTEATNFGNLGLLNVEYILADPETRLPGYVPVKRLDSARKMIYAAADGELTSAAFLSFGAVCFPGDDEALDYIRKRGLRELKARAVLVSNDVSAGPICSRAEQVRQNGDIEIVPVHVRREFDRVQMQVESSSGAVLTLADAYYPGWLVFVDGVERPLLRTYTALRGVALEPGRHLVEFVYAPWVFNLLNRLSNGLLVILLLAGLVAWGMNRVQLREQRTWEVAS